jgi:hypothetical protein
MLRTFALLCLLASPALTETLRLTGGTPTAVAGTDITLTLTEVQDQRCPADVDCYWEGMIRLTLSVASASGPAETIVLCNLCDGATGTATVAGLTLAFETLTPTTAELARKARLPVLADYTAILTVTPSP